MFYVDNDKFDSPQMTKQGLFVGLITLDLIYRVAKFPTPNEKIVAADNLIAAGGPATNAAVTFARLGNRANLLGVVGNHSIANLIKADLEQNQVKIWDLKPEMPESIPVSSIIVTEKTGDRSVISINATKSQADIDRIPPNILAGIDIVLIDGHQMSVSKVIAKQAKANNIPVAIDGGSWKPGFEEVLPYVDYAICSANFSPPNCRDRKEIFAYLSSLEIPHIAITNGAKPIEYLSQGKEGIISVPQVETIDTLGAGDIFHGAFCHYILQQDFISSLVAAAEIASNSCRFFGRVGKCDKIKTLSIHCPLNSISFR